MKYEYFLLLAIFLFSSCTDENYYQEFDFTFFPRQVNTIWSDNVSLIPVVEDKNGKMTYSIDDAFTGNTCKAEHYMLALYTSNVKYDTINIANLIREEEKEKVAELIADWPYEMRHFAPIRFFQNSLFLKSNLTNEKDLLLEERIKDSYTRYANKERSYTSEWGSPSIKQDYRITEVRNLTISCNKQLFGKAAGTSLNEFFDINTLDPFCIVVGNTQMIADNEQTSKKIENGLTINEWISYRPLSATYFYFRFNQTPQEIPVSNLVFNIVMEIAGGKTIECKGRTIDLTK